MAEQIFISYRRGSTADIAGRLDDRFRAHFGDGGVFRDLQDIPLGSDYRQYLARAIGQCDVFVAIVGPDYLDERVRDADDLVRIEIETALSLAKIVIPVLVGNGKLPDPERLPPSLAPLMGRQAAIVGSGRDFEASARDLVQGIVGARRLRGGRGRLSPRLLAAAMGAVVVAAFGVFFFARSKPVDGSAPSPTSVPELLSSSVPLVAAAPPLPPQKKAAPHVPRPTAAAGIPTVRGELDREIVRRVVQHQLAAVKACYEPELATKPELHGRIVVQFTIAASGQVVTSLLQSSTMSNDRVETCTVGVVRRMEFPKRPGGGLVVVSFPFVLEPA